MVTVTYGRGGLGPLLNDGEAVQHLFGCPPDCPWLLRHTHVLVDQAEMAIDSVTDLVLDVRHRTAWALSEAARSGSGSLF